MNVAKATTHRLTKEDDTKIPNAATFTINKEDHTLANLLRSQLLLDPHVLFAGYQLAHPLEPRFTLKVQTDSAEYTPSKAMIEACLAAQITLGKLRDQAGSEITRARVMAGEPVAAQAAGMGQYGGMDETIILQEGQTYAEY